MENQTNEVQQMETQTNEIPTITEEMGIHKEWYREARDMTLDKLPEFLDKLANGYQHDYGTICHAIAAGAVGAAWAVEHGPQGGITGFQAGAIMWEFIQHWNYELKGECGLRLQDMDDLLYPQMEYKFRSISSNVWKAVQKKAAELLAGSNGVDSVREHWQSIVDGKIPFGLTIED